MQFYFPHFIFLVIYILAWDFIFLGILFSAFWNDENNSFYFLGTKIKIHLFLGKKNTFNPKNYN